MNIYLFSLCVVDILMVVLVVLGFVVFCSGCIYKWSEYCWFFGGVRDIVFFVIVFNVLVIIYDRYMVVLRLLYYVFMMINCKVFIIFFVVWVIFFVVLLLRNIWFYLLNEELVKNVEGFYNVIFVIILVFLFFFVLFIVNFKIMRVIKSYGS